MKANFPGIELLKTEPRFEGKRKIRGRVFTYSIKRRIRELHVVVVH